MLNGRADATINDSLSFYDFKKHQPDANAKIVAEQENADYSGVIVRKGDPELVAAINKALDEIKADGTYKKIADTYFGAGRLAVTACRSAGPGRCRPLDGNGAARFRRAAPFVVISVSSPERVNQPCIRGLPCRIGCNSCWNRSARCCGPRLCSPRR